MVYFSARGLRGGGGTHEHAYSYQVQGRPSTERLVAGGTEKSTAGSNGLALSGTASASAIISQVVNFCQVDGTFKASGMDCRTTACVSLGNGWYQETATCTDSGSLAQATQGGGEATPTALPGVFGE